MPHGLLVDLLEALLHEHHQDYPRDGDEQHHLGGHIEQLDVIEDGDGHVPDPVEHDGDAKDAQQLRLGKIREVESLILPEKRYRRSGSHSDAAGRAGTGSRRRSRSRTSPWARIP